METSVKSMNRPPRVMFFGMQGSFSLPSLRSLLNSGIEVYAIIIPGARDLGTNHSALYRRERLRPAGSMLPMLNSSLESNIVQMAWERDIPVWEVNRLSDPATISTLAEYQPDVVCVACFSRRIPRAILEMPRLGCLNVHPSLLPENRGPVPLFWTFRQGCKQTGVTIHLMDEGIDGGGILAQEMIEISNGMSYKQLELECALRGGALLADTVWKLYAGEVTSKPQDESMSTYHGFPRDEDFVVPVAEWDCAHVYNFICGVVNWGEPVVLQVRREHFVVRKAISYSHKDIREASSGNYCWRGKELWIRCKVGWVMVETQKS
jgi:methionyl-tRNA formyltransferase